MTRFRETGDMPEEDWAGKLEGLVEEARERPERLADEAVLAARVGVSLEELREGTRRHYHATAEELLRRARVAKAKRLLLAGEVSWREMAEAVGATPAEFATDFRKFIGMSGADFAKLGNGTGFGMELPEDYPLAYLRRYLGRDPGSATERLKGNAFASGIRIGGEARMLTLHFAPGKVRVEVDRPVSDMGRVHAMAAGLLGLEQETGEFAEMARRLGVARLVEGREGLRIHQTLTVFDGLLWTIIGQQINLRFAFLLRTRLMEYAGTKLGNGLFAPPEPETVAALEPAELLRFQFSRRKADYAISVSRLVAEGKLDLEKLRIWPATRVERELLAIRGLGPWSVNFMMLRSLGFADCHPAGDTGVTSGLRALFGMEERPDREAVAELMARFSPYRSLATAHLWQMNLPPLHALAHAFPEGETTDPKG